mmetsp:Transcript_127311/g.407544  ORF Transcript_127311/g.407544 Transcript_127311/m.407544 type:complete len:240 (-) Transcript_127311:153-872(-)
MGLASMVPGTRQQCVHNQRRLLPQGTTQARDKASQLGGRDRNILPDVEVVHADEHHDGLGPAAVDRLDAPALEEPPGEVPDAVPADGEGRDASAQGGQGGAAWAARPGAAAGRRPGGVPVPEVRPRPALGDRVPDKDQATARAARCRRRRRRAERREVRLVERVPLLSGDRRKLRPWRPRRNGPHISMCTQLTGHVHGEEGPGAEALSRGAEEAAEGEGDHRQQPGSGEQKEPGTQKHE